MAKCSTACKANAACRVGATKYGLCAASYSAMGSDACWGANALSNTAPSTVNIDEILTADYVGCVNKCKYIIDALNSDTKSYASCLTDLNGSILKLAFGALMIIALIF